MSDANSKKAEERRLLELFLERAGIAATIAEEREAPDFVIKVESRLVGVEVTELHYDDGGPIALKAAESICDGVVAEAWSLYKVLGGRPVHVSFLFSNGAELKRMRRDQAARTLAEFMLGLDPPLDNLLDLRRYGSDPFPAVDELIGLHILAVDEWPKAIWHALKGGWVAPLEDLRIQGEVDAKAPKIDIYRKAASEVWLVIATLGRGPSQFFHIPSGTTRLGPTVRSAFDRTFYLSGFEGKVYELG